MGRSDKPGAKAERDRLRTTLLAQGCSVDEVAHEFRARWQFPPMTAYRYAADLTQVQVASRYNETVGDASASVDSSLISKLEQWPIGRGAKAPTAYNLTILAAVYGTLPYRLVAPEDTDKLPGRDQLVLRATRSPHTVGLGSAPSHQTPTEGRLIHRTTHPGPLAIETARYPTSITSQTADQPTDPQPVSRNKSPRSFGQTDGTLASSQSDIDGLTAEILSSHTSDEALDQLARAAESLAESHTQAPARRVLKELFCLHEQVRILLDRKQRLSQKRELFRIESNILAHACLLLDDVKQNAAAQQYGLAALSFAKEAGTTQAAARTALAKALRWAERFVESADMARLGYEHSPATPIRIQLASQEANAAALLGNAHRARDALARAQEAAATVPVDSEMSAWSFPAGRQAIFTLSVALQAGQPDAALRAAEMADASWATGAPFSPANWAQIRIGASVAYLSKGLLDAAIEEVSPAFTLAPELRISTVTAYMANLDQQLRQPRLHANKDAIELRQRIRDFNTSALPDEQPTESG